MKYLKSLIILLGVLASLLAQVRSETITYVHTDMMGSPIAETDESGNVLWREHYTPFGEKVDKEAASVNNSIGYTGHVNDSDTGLTYMQARYYDPVIGRFYSNDPIGYTARNPVMSFNRYMYVNNNPYKYTDPNGEFLHIGIGALIGAIGGAASAALNGGSFEDVVASAGAGALIGGVAAATGGASLLAVAGAGAVTGALSDATAQTIVNFDGDNVDSLGAAATEIVDAVSDVNLKEVAVSGALGALGGAVTKLATTMKFTETAAAVSGEVTNVLTSAKKDELAQ